MTTERYNGWTNLETCIVNSWIRNESGLYFQNSILDFIKSIKEELIDFDEQVSRLSQHLGRLLFENRPESNGDVYSELLRTSLRVVNYHEIAAYMLKDY